MAVEKVNDEIQNDSPPDSELRWAEWMRLAQGGSSEAYEMLLTDISPALESFISKRVFDRNSVEDIVQETLLGIHKARATFDPNKSFGAWMYAIARYKLTDFIRKKSRQKLKEIDGLPIDLLNTGLEQTNEEHPLIDTLQFALENLPDRQKHIVTKLKLEGHSIKEIALDLGMSESAVKVDAHRAYKKILKIMESNLEK